MDVYPVEIEACEIWAAQTVSAAVERAGDQRIQNGWDQYPVVVLPTGIDGGQVWVEVEEE
jgi:hypothetical protein